MFHQEWEDYVSAYSDFINTLIPSNFSLDVIDASTIPNIYNDLYEVINDGVLLYTYIGHGGWNNWSVPWLTYTELENNLSNSNKTPIVFGHACQTGWFDKNQDCFAESLTTYSDNDGFTGYIGASRSFWAAYGVGYVNDPPSYSQELFPYAIFQHLSHIVGEAILEMKISLANPGQRFAFNYFGDPALNIMAQGFEITHDIVLLEPTVISSPIIVKNGAKLILTTNNHLFFENNGNLTIEEGATLTLGPNSTVTGNKPTQNIRVKGILNIDQFNPRNLNAFEGTSWGGIIFENDFDSYTLNGWNIENCKISGHCKKLTVKNSTFSNSGIKYAKGDLKIIGSDFDNSKVDVANGGSRSSFVEINNSCSFSNCQDNYAISISNYYNYLINNCTVENNLRNGIGIFNSGGVKSTKEISNNSILNNGLVNNGSGIEIYHSYSNIGENQLIEGNWCGISCFDNSNVSVKGIHTANTINETQLIKDNVQYQLFSTENSFPFYFHYNAIIDEDNISPLLYYSPINIPTQDLQVSKNYWGNNFVPEEDLFPSSLYVYEPFWYLNGKGVVLSVEEDYEAAQTKIVQEDYIGAKEALKEIIIDYPNSKYAQASLRELFSLEELVANDYEGLKSFYSSDPSIENIPDLEKLANHLANFCEIKLENYPTAINWFEDIIQNPESVEDSIFAIIDLGYTYYLMEMGENKSNYAGKMLEFKPKSQQEFICHRDYLLSLLQGNQMSEEMKENIAKLKEGELLQNIPNPFTDKTQLWYKVQSDANVEIKVYNNTGQLIRTFVEGAKTKGTHYVDMDASGLPAGIYFYSISINGNTTDSKKMTIMK